MKLTPNQRITITVALVDLQGAMIANNVASNNQLLSATIGNHLDSAPLTHDEINELIKSIDRTGAIVLVLNSEQRSAITAALTDIQNLMAESDKLTFDTGVHSDLVPLSCTQIDDLIASIGHAGHNAHGNIATH